VGAGWSRGGGGRRRRGGREPAPALFDHQEGRQRREVVDVAICPVERAAGVQIDDATEIDDGDGTEP
jgi:hypothetical protein